MIVVHRSSSFLSTTLFRFKIMTAICVVLLFSSVFSKNAWSNSEALLLSGTTYKSEYGAVATVHPVATQVAAKQLENGGNAIDAAIAAALTLGVVDSYNSGIGGGLFALVHWPDGKVEAIDAREMAPMKAYRDMYLREGKAQSDLSRHGALAIGIPGSVAAFEYLSEKGGQQPISSIYKSAAAIARKGFIISPSYHKRLKRTAAQLAQFDAAATIFLDQQGQPWPVGHRLIQKDLANTYDHIAQSGSEYFYRGVFAEKIDQWMKNNKGLISKKDFVNYQLRHRHPIVSEFMGHKIYGFPPPSSGGVHVAEILNILQQFDVKALPDIQRHHVLVEAMKLAFADRAHWLGDPDFVDVPKGLIHERYGKQLAKKIDLTRTTKVPSYGNPFDASQALFQKHTTHISVADKAGHWVSITTTLNTSFGSKVVVPTTGVLMNNQMDDFSAQPNVPNAYGLVGSEANSIQAGKRPLSSMSPTIVVKDRQPIMAIGAAGGPMIITQVTQALIRYLALDQTLYEALASSRVHQQWKPDTVFFDKTLSPLLQAALEKKGHVLKQLRFEGSSNAVSLRSGQFDAVSEPRLVERNQLLSQ